MKTNVKRLLTIKDDKEAYKYTLSIIEESETSNKWYKYFDDYVFLLDHPKSLVRNRAIMILASISKWDKENKIESIIDEYLLHINDEKPITSRQCIKSLVDIGRYKPQLIPKITKALKKIDLSQYNESMRTLIEKDCLNTIERLSENV